jgi:hypothetical protein
MTRRRRTQVEDHVEDQDEQQRGGARQRDRHDLERRVRLLEQQVVTLAAAVDAASRMRPEPSRSQEGVPIPRGRLVRRILEKGRLVQGYGGTRGTR